MATIGIDLGTTNSRMAVARDGEPVLIPNAEGAHVTPSVVTFTASGKPLVGAPALDSIAHRLATIYSVRRHLGDERIDSGEGKTYAPAEVAAHILTKLKTDAEAFLGEPVGAAVLSVPPSFGQAQREATKEAARRAGLEVPRLIHDTTAALLAQGDAGTVLVVSVGGGTVSVAVAEVGDGLVDVKAAAGTVGAGGVDIDEAIVGWLVANVAHDEGIALSRDELALKRLFDAAEVAKVELSTVAETEVSLPYIAADASGARHLSARLKRETLEQLAGPLIETVGGLLRSTLDDARRNGVAEFDHAMLVGGMARMPLVFDQVAATAGRVSTRDSDADDVARGAAIQAGLLTGDVKDLLVLDVTPLTLGLETVGGVMTTLIERNTTIPTHKAQTFTTAHDNQASVEIHVLQGEHAMVADNTSLGRFELPGIPPAKRGRRRSRSASTSTPTGS